MANANLELKVNKTITINAEVFENLMKVKEEFDSAIESIELMADKNFIKSLQKAKQEVKNRDFTEWSSLTKNLK